MRSSERYARSVLSVLVLFAGAVSAHEPLVIAHRGASGYLPEHTLAAYELAIEQGADVIEPDLVFTRDGVLVARHDRYLSTTTDVADRPEFSSRRRMEGLRRDWFVDDFTLAELKMLRARQSFEGRSTEADGLHEIPTLQEVIDLVRRKQAAGSGSVGLYPETKSPAHFRDAGFDFATALVDVLEANDLPNPSIPVIVQSFEADVLRDLSVRTDLRLAQLVRPKNRAEANVPNIPLETIATYADGVGAMKFLLVTRSGADSGFVARAQALGLFVHAWTFRDDALPPLEPDAASEYDRYIALEVDGLFTDFPDTALAAVARHRNPH